jgi:hypothetical protein
MLLKLGLLPHITTPAPPSASSPPFLMLLSASASSPLKKHRENKQSIMPIETRLKNRKAIEQIIKLPTAATRRRQFFPAD